MLTNTGATNIWIRAGLMFHVAWHSSSSARTSINEAKWSLTIHTTVSCFIIPCRAILFKIFTTNIAVLTNHTSFKPTLFSLLMICWTPLSNMTCTVCHPLNAHFCAIVSCKHLAHNISWRSRSWLPFLNFSANQVWKFNNSYCFIFFLVKQDIMICLEGLKWAWKYFFHLKKSKIDSWSFL